VKAYGTGPLMETRLHVRSLDSMLPPEEFARLPRCPVTVILDDLRSAFNVGSIVRTADCSRIEKIVFCGITAHPPNPKLEKTALGAMSALSWEYASSVELAIHRLKEAGVPVIALETTNISRPLWEFMFPLPVGLVVGNEALGVSKRALSMADDVVEIPMLGFKNSINAAVAFGIVAYEIQRQHWSRLKLHHELKNRIELERGAPPIREGMR
jgi:23S rRNA (guanosine2251-2'-O)-methyltransferase